eukprot:8777473-Pyramimonas_sp.AAC.1
MECAVTGRCSVRWRARFMGFSPSFVLFGTEGYNSHVKSAWLGRWQHPRDKCVPLADWKFRPPPS